MRTISTTDAPEAIGPYSQAVAAGGWVFTSGIIGLTPSGEMAGTSAKGQAEQIFSNLRAVLSAGGCDLSDVIKVTVYMKNLNDFSIVNEIYARHFGEHRPARSTVEVAALPKGALIELDAVAFTG